MTTLAIAAAAGLIFSTAGYADDDVPKDNGPRPIMGDVIIFNDEIVEPVSLPVSTCGGMLTFQSQAPTDCRDTSRVSDDDA